MLHLLMLAGLFLTVEPSGLRQVYPLDLQGESFRRVLTDLTQKMGLEYTLEVAVDDTFEDRPIRLYAQHLTGAQLIRWVTRLAGQEAVLIDQMLVIAAPEQMPVWWRLQGHIAAGDTGSLWPDQIRSDDRPSSQPTTMPQKLSNKNARGISTPLPLADYGRWPKQPSRAVAIDWLDAPLSRVARDISDQYGIDVVIDHAVRKDQPLVLLQASEILLDSVLARLQDQLGFCIDYWDGAIWLHEKRREVVDEPGADDARPPVFTSRYCHIRQPIRSWAAFSQYLHEGLSPAVRMKVPSADAAPGIEAVGPVDEVLEAARLCGLIYWSRKANSSDGAEIVEIEVR